MFLNNPRLRTGGSNIWFKAVIIPWEQCKRLTWRWWLISCLSLVWKHYMTKFLWLCSLGNLIHNFFYCLVSCLDARVKLCKNRLVAFISILWKILKMINVCLLLKVWCNSAAELLTKGRIFIRILILLLVIDLFKVLISSWLTHTCTPRIHPILQIFQFNGIGMFLWLPEFHWYICSSWIL